MYDSAQEVASPRDPTPIATELATHITPQEEWKQKVALMDDLADELGLPRFGDFTAEEISEPMIKAAIDDQVQRVESRISHAGKKWTHRENTILPLWFHLPQGKDVIRRLSLCGRFTQPEIAAMLGLRERQLKDFLKSLGATASESEKARTLKMRQYKELVAEGATRGKMLITKIVVARLENYIADEDNPSGALHIKAAELAKLNEILVNNDPAANEPKGAPYIPGVGSIAIGVKVTHIDKDYVPGKPPIELEE